MKDLHNFPFLFLMADNNEIVKLNIGGVKYTTTKSTLCKTGENFFSGLFSGKLTALKDEEGCIFIDRNGAYFAPILDFLRTGDFDTGSISIEQLEKEAKFYLIKLPKKIVEIGILVSQDLSQFRGDSDIPSSFQVKLHIYRQGKYTRTDVIDLTKEFKEATKRGAYSREYHTSTRSHEVRYDEFIIGVLATSGWSLFSRQKRTFGVIFQRIVTEM